MKIDLIGAIIVGMQRAFLCVLIVVGVLGVSCSKGLRGGTDAGRDSGLLECAGLPPEACGYVCQDGVWVASSEPCLRPDSAVAGEPDAKAKDGAATDTGGAISTGGTTGSGGVTATGGTTANGGATAAGGTAATGGATSGTGGVTGGGGITSTGAVTATGGVTGKGGSTVVGGSTGAGGNRSYDAGAAAGCVDLAGTWRVSGSCLGPRSAFNGSFSAVMTQAGCAITFTQTDDKTPTQWISSGRLENTGRGYLRGDFGFTDSIQCDLNVTTEGWDMICGSATQQCQLKGKRDVP